MQEGLANNLGLKCDDTLILDSQICTLWSGEDLDTAFPGNGVLRMEAFPCTFFFGYSSIFPKASMDNLLVALASTTPATFSCGIPPAGVSIALSTLAKNGSNSFLDKINQIGMKVVKFKQVFLEEHSTAIQDTCVLLRRLTIEALQTVLLITIITITSSEFHYAHAKIDTQLSTKR